MANVTVILTVEDRPGILSSAVTSLRRFGLTFERHRTHEEQTSGRRRMVIEANGVLTDPEGLAGRLAAIRGVVGVDPIGAGTTAAGPSPSPGPEMAPPRPSAVKVSEELVQAMLADYPRIMGQFQQFELSLPADDRQTPQRELGYRLGLALAERHRAGLEASLDLGRTLENVVVPALERLAQAQVTADDALEVPISVFTRRYLNSMDLTFGAELDHCWFLGGLVQGLLERSPHLGPVRVTEERCRAVGDETCLFRIRTN